MKKKWYEKPKTVVASIAAVIVAVGIIWNWIISLVNFSRWPEVTKVIAGEVSKVQEIKVVSISVSRPIDFPLMFN